MWPFLLSPKEKSSALHCLCPFFQTSATQCPVKAGHIFWGSVNAAVFMAPRHIVAPRSPVQKVILQHLIRGTTNLWYNVWLYQPASWLEWLNPANVSSVHMGSFANEALSDIYICYKRVRHPSPAKGTFLCPPLPIMPNEMARMLTIYQSQSAWSTVIDSRRPIGWEGAVNWAI